MLVVSIEIPPLVFPSGFASLQGGSVRGKYGFLPSQGKMSECYMTIQKYDWVSNNAKLYANGWSVPLTTLKANPKPKWNLHGKSV